MHCLLVMSTYISRSRGVIDLEAKFEPNLLNTAIYLLSLSQQVSTFAINFQVCSIYITASCAYIAAGSAIPRGYPGELCVVLGSDGCQCCGFFRCHGLHA